MTEYRIKDLMLISGTTERAIRQLFTTNEELKQLKEEHTIKKQNKVFYDEVIYRWFVEYYKDKNSQLVSNVLPQQNCKTQDSEIPDSIAPVSLEISKLSAQIEELTKDLDDMRAKYEALEAEKNELLRQNGNLLLLLSQEKAEKQALLPPPRRTLGERIKGLFHKKESE